MPKPVNHVPSYCRHRASGQGYVTLDGRDIYLGTYGSKGSREKYDRTIAEWIAAGRRLPTDPHDITVAEIVAAFRKHARAYYGPASKAAANIDESLKYVVKLYARTPAAEFGPLRLKAVREAMIAAGVVRSNINRHVTRIRGVFKWAAENELIPASVYHGLMAVKGLQAGRSGAVEGEPVKPVAVEHVEATLPFVSAQVAAMVRLQLLTGMRPAECCIMRGMDIDASGRLWAYRPAHHKNEHRGHDRVVYLGPKAQAIIKPFLKPDLSAYLFDPRDAESTRRSGLSAERKTPMSCGNRPGTNRRRRRQKSIGDRYTVLSYYNAIRRSCDEAFPPPDNLARGKVAMGKTRQRFETLDEWKNRLGEAGWAELAKWRADHRWFPYQLRHTAATLLRKEHGLEAAQVILGHKTLSVTQIYAEKNVEAAMKIMAEVG